MNHFMDLDVIRYRGIDGLSIKKAAKINLVVGPNGIGKTSLLEAIWLFNNKNNPKTLWHFDLSRSGYEYVNPVAELGSGKKIHLAGTQNGIKQDYRVTFEKLATESPARKKPRLKVSQKPVVGKLHVALDKKELDNFSIRLLTRKGYVVLPGTEPAEYPSEFLMPNSSLGINFQRFSEVVRQGAKKTLMQKLRFIHPLLNDVDMVMGDDGEPYILATTEEGKRLMLEDLGSGMERVFNYFIAIFSSRNSLVCIDEIETSLHHTLLLKFWKSIKNLNEEFNIQTFATTHSKECIDAAINAFGDKKEDLKIYALYRNKGDKHVDVVAYSGDDLDVITDLNMEIRGI